MLNNEAKDVLDQGLNEDNFDRLFVDLIARGLPYTLAKACLDPFFYSVLLKDGTYIEFAFAEYVNHKWIKVQNFGDERWLEINLDEVLFCSESGNKYQSVKDMSGRNK
jgi:hypothetical protein